MWIKDSEIFSKVRNSDILVTSFTSMRVSMLIHYWGDKLISIFWFGSAPLNLLSPPITVYPRGFHFTLLWQAPTLAQGLRGSICCRTLIRYHPYIVLNFWGSLKVGLYGIVHKVALKGYGFWEIVSTGSGIDLCWAAIHWTCTCMTTTVVKKKRNITRPESTS